MGLIRRESSQNSVNYNLSAAFHVYLFFFPGRKKDGDRVNKKWMRKKNRISRLETLYVTLEITKVPLIFLFPRQPPTPPLTSLFVNLKISPHSKYYAHIHNSLDSVTTRERWNTRSRNKKRGWKNYFAKRRGKKRTFDAGQKKNREKKGKSYFCWDCTGSRAQFLHVSERLNTVFPNKD